MTEQCCKDGNPPAWGRDLAGKVAVKRTPLGSPVTATIPSIRQVLSQASVCSLGRQDQATSIQVVIYSVRQFPPAGTASHDLFLLQEKKILKAKKFTEKF